MCRIIIIPRLLGIGESMLARCLRSHARLYCTSGVSLWDSDITNKVRKDIENRWRDEIHNQSCFDDHDLSNKMYILSMFPYPSGKLHMGHVRVYTISDAVARFHRMNGKNVLHPIGWDAFGLPAENAAKERNIPADKWTCNNIEQMRNQLKQLGCSFDWSREISTCSPDYYKWTQYIFLQMFKNGLVYQKEAVVNWDPIDKTVLAHEQVDESGYSWRSGAKVEKKLLKQWFIRTTKFAKDLYDGLNDTELHDWRDILKIQRHWIGECNGVNFDFQIKDDNQIDMLTVWTSKPEMIADAKFIAINDNCTLANKESEFLNDHVRKLKLTAENPFTKTSLPIYITDLINYEESCNVHLGIPTASETDRKFAESVGIKIPEFRDTLSEEDVIRKQIEICKKAQSLGIGGYWTSAKLQDWLISRQRYWGTPIPIIHCDKCGPVAVPDDQLPVNLPNSFSDRSEWILATCPKCGGNGKRETDTMDTFVDSSWYYMRYLDNNNEKEPFSKDIAKHLMPVDLYIGGKEHAVLHLYYARFLSHFLFSQGMLPQKEPFRRLLVQGMIMGQTFKSKETGKYMPASQVKFLDKKKKKAVDLESGKPVVVSWDKMSKSKLNGVDPDEMFAEYGVDTTRLIILADVAPTSQRNWSSATFPGILNWQHRLWLTMKNFRNLRRQFPQKCPEDKFEEQENILFDSRNFYIKGTTFNYYTSQQMSVAVSKMQGLTNSIRRALSDVVARGRQYERALATQIIMLAPMAPHFASELWAGFQTAPNRINVDANDFDWNRSVLEQKWPEVDLNYNLDLMCWIHGAEHVVAKIPRHELEKMNIDEALSIALRHDDVQNILQTRKLIKSDFIVQTGYRAVIKLITKKINNAE